MVQNLKKKKQAYGYTWFKQTYHIKSKWTKLVNKKNWTKTMYNILVCK
jgi:hypothetical protein